jgi:uncharacterized protein involved in response to NO
MFPAGALHAVAIILIWGVVVEARRQGAPLALAPDLAPATWHAHSLLFGTFGFYIFGFLGTAFPRWIDAPAPTASRLATWLALLVSAQVLLGVSLFAGGAKLLALAAVLEITAFISLLVTLGSALAHADHPRRAQPALVLAGVALAPIAAGLDAVAALKADAALHASAVVLATHGFLLLVVAGVAQRIIPFFTANVLHRAYTPRPPALLGIWIFVALVRVVIAMAAPQAALQVIAALDVLLGVALAIELSSWRPGPALRRPMIAILYLGLAWIAVALMLGAIECVRPDLAPLWLLPRRHALVIGGFATLIVGMSTRVALGHSGRPIAASGALLGAFVAIQVAVVLRVGMALAGGLFPTAPVWTHIAAIPFATAFALWIWRLAPRIRVRFNRPG